MTNKNVIAKGMPAPHNLNLGDGRKFVLEGENDTEARYGGCMGIQLTYNKIAALDFGACWRAFDDQDNRSGWYSSPIAAINNLF